METPDAASLRTLALVDPLGLTWDTRDRETSERFDHAVRDLLAGHDGREIEKSGRFLFVFERPVDAVRFCLACHEALQEASLEVRAAVHLGEVRLRENPREHVDRGAKPLELEGVARHTAARVLSLATAGQTLLTRAAFELARRALVGEGARGEGRDLTWLAHGDYRFERPDEIIEVFEVGLPGVAPLAPPPPREQIRRASMVENDEDAWRPAAGREIPGRTHWLLEERVDDEPVPGHLEVWRARHAKTHELRRVYLGYTPADRSALERQVEVLSRLQRKLGGRDDLPRLLDWSLEGPPYVVETTWSDAPTLASWARDREGLATVPRDQRLELAARVADVVAAVHGTGVVFGSLSAEQIRTDDDSDPTPQPRWATGLGFRRSTGDEAAEDVRELGILTYRLAAGDLSLPWAPFWERDVDDELLREDVAAATDRDVHRRISAEELARRLRTLDDRRAEKDKEHREREGAEARPPGWQYVGWAALGLLAFLVWCGS